MKKVMSIIVICLLFTIPHKAEGAKFTSLRGFSLNYPDSWIVATKDDRNIISNEAKSAFKKAGDIDFSKVAVFIFNPTDDDFIESIGVTVLPFATKTNKEAEKKAVKAMTDSLSQLTGIKPANVESSIAVFGGKKAISFEYDMSVQGQTVHQWNVAIPGKNQTYLVTCSAHSSEYKKYMPIFNQVITSLKVDSGIGGLWYSLSGGIRYAIIGALIGLAISVFGSLFKNKKEE